MRWGKLDDLLEFDQPCFDNRAHASRRWDLIWIAGNQLTQRLKKLKNSQPANDCSCQDNCSRPLADSRGAQLGFRMLLSRAEIVRSTSLCVLYPAKAVSLPS